MLEMYIAGVTLVVARNNARTHIPAVLDLVAAGKIEPARVTDRIVAWAEAEEALSDPPDKLVILGPGISTELAQHATRQQST